jgi:hypothetical protein
VEEDGLTIEPTQNPNEVYVLGPEEMRIEVYGIPELGTTVPPRDAPRSRLIQQPCQALLSIPGLRPIRPLQSNPDKEWSASYRVIRYAIRSAFSSSASPVIRLLS